MHPTILARRLGGQLVLALLVSACMAGGQAPERLPTSSPAPAVPCAYMWAHRDAPGVPERVTAALSAAGLTATRVGAELFGEECAAPGQPSAFLAMETRIAITQPVDDLNDRVALGQLISQVVQAIGTIGETPGPRQRLQLTFTQGDQSTTLDFETSLAEQVMERGLSGAELFEALSP